MEEKQELLSVEEQEKQSRRSLYEWAEAIIFAMLLATVFCACFFRMVTVDGDSMLNTLHNKDSLLMVNAFYNEPQYGDIVVVQQGDDAPLIKRVIAKEGDTIAIDPVTEEVILNGQVLEEPYLDFSTPTLYGFTGPYTVPEDSVFVMGDNRVNSHDSRDLDGIGAVHKDDIMGKAIFRVLPIADIGTIG